MLLEKVAMIWEFQYVNVADSSTEGIFKVAVFSQNRERRLGETKVAYIDLIEEALKQAISCPKTMQKFIQAAIPCLAVHAEGGTRDAENHTNDGRYFHFFLSLLFPLYPFNSIVLNPVNKEKK